MADEFIKAALRPLEQNFGALLGGRRETRINPTDTVGAPGTAIYSGYIVESEKDAALTDRERYRAFSEALANTSIVAAGVRYFLNLAGGATWQFEAADHPRGEELAEMAEQMLTEDPKTTWPRIVRRAAMYRFLMNVSIGFSAALASALVISPASSLRLSSEYGARPTGMPRKSDSNPNPSSCS